MQYLGGKTRIGKKLALVIDTFTDDVGGAERPRELMSLFCGSCAVESRVKSFDHIYLNDKHPYLIALLKAVQDGYVPPTAVSQEEYHRVKQNPDADPKLTGFVGFGCSFGGKWWGGYARSRKARNYAEIGSRTLLRDMAPLMKATISCLDYRDVKLPKSCVIYADPPYDSPTGYSLGKFDSEEFWKYARETSKEHLMFVSEEKAPDDFVSVLEIPFRRDLNSKTEDRFAVFEKLFVHTTWYKKWKEAMHV